MTLDDRPTPGYRVVQDGKVIECRHCGAHSPASWAVYRAYCPACQHIHPGAGIALDALGVRVLAADRVAVVYPSSFGRARLTLSSADSMARGDLDDIWEYEDRPRALAELESWDGEGDPDGWFHHRRTGRRRPGGDAARECIAGSEQPPNRGECW